MWGAIIVVWAIIMCIPILNETADMFFGSGNFDSIFNKISYLWIIGFVLLLLLWGNGFEPQHGITFTIVYTIISFAVYVGTEKNNTQLIKFFSIPARVIISISLCWIFLVQIWGFLYNWEDYFELIQFIALNLFPIAVLLLLFGFYRWISHQ